MKRPPIRFEFEVKVVSGEEGRELRLEQARAIRELLMWFHEQRAGTNDEPDRQPLSLEQAQG